MKIGVQLHPQATTVAQMRAGWRTAEALGVDSIWVWDHFFPLYGEPDESHFEAYTLLAAMAADTSHAQIGALVTCYSYRNPHLLADMARTIDHISDGRFVLAVGSGWFARDYTEYGYEFGTAVGRLKNLETGLPVIQERLGKLNPGPVNGSLPLMIGGGGEKFTLRLVAEHADMSNVFGPVENVQHKNNVIDEWCRKIGRNPKEIERTVLIDPEDLEHADAFAEAGANHLIVTTVAPFDLTEVGKLIGSRN
jgi:probable F420-dependent oxidoreductase